MRMLNLQAKHGNESPFGPDGSDGSDTKHAFLEVAVGVGIECQVMVAANMIV